MSGVSPSQWQGKAEGHHKMSRECFAGSMLLLTWILTDDLWGKISTVSLSQGWGGIRERERGHACYIHHFSLFKWEYVEQVVTLKKVILHTEMLPGFTVLEWWAYSSRGSA